MNDETTTFIDGKPIAVTCCKDGGIMSSPGCKKGVTFVQAESHCKSSGYRLCTKQGVYRIKV